MFPTSRGCRVSRLRFPHTQENPSNLIRLIPAKGSVRAGWPGTLAAAAVSGCREFSTYSTSPTASQPQRNDEAQRPKSEGSTNDDTASSRAPFAIGHSPFVIPSEPTEGRQANINPFHPEPLWPSDFVILII